MKQIINEFLRIPGRVFTPRVKNGFVSAGRIAKCLKNKSLHHELQVEGGLRQAMYSLIARCMSRLYTVLPRVKLFPLPPHPLTPQQREQHPAFKSEMRSSSDNTESLSEPVMGRVGTKALR